MKIQEQLELLNSTPGVLEAYTSKDPVAVGTKHHAVTIIWYYMDEEIVRKGVGELIVTKLGKPLEEAKWFERIPNVLEVRKTPDLGPLGTDADVLSACPVKVVKAEIERGNNEARVSGYELIDGKAVPVVFLLYTDGIEVKVVREESAAAVKAI